MYGVCGAKPPNMENKKLIRFVESFLLLPVMTIGMPQGVVPNASVNLVLTPQSVLAQKLNSIVSGSDAFNQEADQEAKILKLKADAIDAYFKEHDMPLEGTGIKMAKEAEANNLDWRLVAAISVRESTGGKKDCIKVKNNPFGWGSCKIGFESLDEAIETVAKNLGGNNPKTAKHYDGKTTKEILQKYNPPSIVKKYAEQVMAIMDDIGDPDVGVEIAKS
jgi:hypothetical protein